MMHKVRLLFVISCNVLYIRLLRNIQTQMKSIIPEKVRKFKRVGVNSYPKRNLTCKNGKTVDFKIQV